MYEIGTGKSEITCFKEGVGMMGYGMYFNNVHDVLTPLFVRAFIIKSPSSGKKIAFITAELCMIGQGVKLGVVKKLHRHYPQYGWQEDNIVLTAQHTHSGPGGYFHYGFYNFTIPGFVPEVYQGIVDGIVDAVVQAEQSLRPGTIHMDRGSFAESDEVAFNRSLKAYNANPEVTPLPKSKAHLAVDREMSLLRFEGEDGEHIGAISWFAVHTTSMHNDNHSICSDNKGFAAEYFETDMRQEETGKDFIAAFAQGSAGDVSPNYIYDKKKRWTRGKFKSDVESARYNGKLQYHKAKDIYQKAGTAKAIKGDLDYAQILVNFANTEADPDFTHGKKGCKTGPSCHGVAFFAGTKEGPGMSWFLAGLSGLMCDIMKGYEYVQSLFLSKSKRKAIYDKYRVQGKKKILVETGERKVLATRDVKNLFIPGFVDRTLATFKKHHREGGLDNKPWTAQVLPLQIVTIGDIALASVPAEPSTVSGRRLHKTISETLAAGGFREVILTPYANAYCGYITTPEEYRFQLYEGGHTVFGKWTLPAFQTHYRKLAREMVKRANERKLQTQAERPEFSKEELERRKFSDQEAYKIN